MAPIIAAAIPYLLKALASPAVAGTAAAFIGEKLGLSESTIEAVTNVINGLKPEDQLKAKELDLAFKQFIISQNNQIVLAELGLQQTQLEINKAEAQHPSLFVAGWRPALGWIGVISLGLASIPKSIALTVLWTLNAWNSASGLPAFPDLGTGDVVALLGTILGTGIMRSVDKYHEVETERVSAK